MSSQPVSLTASVLRPLDLLALRFEFINLTLRRGRVTGEPPRLVRISPESAAYLLVHFPPQHVAEETLLQTTETDDAAVPPADAATPTLPPPTLVADRPPIVQSILANPSQLAFRIPDDVTAIPFTLAALLDWRRFDLIAQTGAAVAGPVTRIEIPYRMILTPSPIVDAATPESANAITWTHSIGPATRQGWTELWHTRIGTKLAGEYDKRGAPVVVETGPWHIVPVEARKAPDERDACELWFTTTPLPSDRTKIVAQTGNAGIPRGILAEQFMLTSLGAWLDLDAHWDLSPAVPIVPIAQWRHVATMGRDQYVKVVRRGFLFPFGHRALWITEVRREFREGPPPAPSQATPTPVDVAEPPPAEDTSVAYLIRREFLVVVEQEKDYSLHPEAFPDGTGGRDMPMQRVRLLTTVTPPLDNRPDATDYWPRVGGQPFAFEITGQDMAGQWSTFSMPLRFLPVDYDPENTGCGTLGDEDDDSLSAAGALRALPARQTEQESIDAANALAESWVSEYRNTALAPFAPGLGSLRQAALNGQKLAIVPPIPNADSSVKAARVAFSAVVPDNLAALPLGTPNFLPILEQADVNLPAVDQLAGALALPTTIGISQTYLRNEFDPLLNKGQVFAEVIGGVTDLNFPQDKAGRVLATAAKQQILGLSQTLGAITGDIAAAQEQLGEVQDQLAAAKNQLSAIANGEFDPKAMLGTAKALGMSLIELLEGAGEVIGVEPGVLADVKGQVDDLTNVVSSAENLQQRIKQELATRRAALQQAIADGEAELQAQIQAEIDALEGAVTAAQDQLDAAKAAVEGYLSDASTLIRVPLLTTRLVFDLPAVEIPDLPEDIVIPPVPDLPEIPKAIETSYIWKPKLATEKDFIPGIFKYRAIGDSQLRVTTNLRQDLTGGPPQFRVDGEMRSFALEFLAGTVTVSFTKVTFKSEQGSKIDFDPEVSDIDFGGDLAFVTELLNILPAGLFGDGFSVDVSKDGASAELAIAIPSFAFGAFSLENLAMSARLLLPFAEKPVSLRFAFSERHNPFLVGVLVFAGTGFFSLQIDTKGDLVCEAALEFGAQVALDVGVASGRLYIFGGIYFRMEESPESVSVTLSGYVRAGGEVSVLGIASASIEFLIALTYVSDTGKAEGSASVKACISLMFFSKCVSFTVRRQFAGSAEDPSFTDMMDLADWSEYCGAFAA